MLIEIAATSAERRRGLLGRTSYDGMLWFPGVRQIHTFGMRFAIEVAWIGRDHRVLRVQGVAPNRLTAWVRRSHGVFEAEPGVFEDVGIFSGGLLAPHLRDGRFESWGTDPGGNPDRQPR